MDPVREGEDNNDSEEEEESYGGLQECRRRKGAMAQEMQRVKRGIGKGGEVTQFNGGRIVRATGRKDRHSKVCTARGTRDRRVRLSPNTAIQFYDVQDRLGYDRPSKAIDWLMKEAKAEIEALNSVNPIQPKEKQNINDECGISNPSFSVFPMENVSDLHPSCLSYPDLVSSSSSIFFFDDQRLISWNANPENGKPEEALSFTYAAQTQTQSQVFSQREPLQSSFFPHSFSYAAVGSAGNEFSGLSPAEEHHLASGRPASLLDYQS